MLRRFLASAAVLLLVACTGDRSPADRRAALTEDLAGDLVVETEGALDTEQAHCVAEALVEAVGVRSFERVVAAAGGDENDDGLRLTVIDAFSGCDALEPLLRRPEG